MRRNFLWKNNVCKIHLLTFCYILLKCQLGLGGIFSLDATTYATGDFYYS